jgi:AGZA family xanthine/uracil permease-like MFS transporter
MLENYFNYKKHKTDFKTEVIAGTTTFLTMAYIMFLNPFILSGEFAGPEKVSLTSAQFILQQY